MGSELEGEPWWAGSPPPHEGCLPDLGGGLQHEAGPRRAHLGKPSALEGRCVTLLGAMEQLVPGALSERPAQHCVKAHKENAKDSARRVRTLVCLSPRGSESPDREGTA